MDTRQYYLSSVTFLESNTYHKKLLIHHNYSMWKHVKNDYFYLTSVNHLSVPVDWMTEK